MSRNESTTQIEQCQNWDETLTKKLKKFNKKYFLKFSMFLVIFINIDDVWSRKSSRASLKIANEAHVGIHFLEQRSDFNAARSQLLLF